MEPGLDKITIFSCSDYKQLICVSLLWLFTDSGKIKGKSHLFLLCTLQRVDEWMAKEGLLDPNVKSIFVTCGDWDLKVM